MFKPVHGLNAVLQAAINSGDTALFLDSTSIALLQARLGTGNYTYAVVSSGISYEVVKITSVQATSVTVIRAQDGTTASAFPSGAALQFVLGESAIQDILAEKMLAEISITGTGIAVVNKIGLNNYTVFVPQIGITSSSPDIIVSGTYPNFVISAPIKSDCCA